MASHATVVAPFVLLGALIAAPAAAFETVWRNGFDLSANFASPLGTNLDGVEDFSTSYNFVDVMKQSRDWITQDTTGMGVFDTLDEACLDLDADGYVHSLTPQTGNPGCSTTRQGDPCTTLGVLPIRSSMLQ